MNHTKKLTQNKLKIMCELLIKKTVRLKERHKVFRKKFAGNKKNPQLCGMVICFYNINKYDCFAKNTL
jgi:hypothetical protein